MLIDIDHFKEINDTYGHTAGDAVLKQVSLILKSTLKESDYIIRWGGEEFLIIAKNIQRQHAPKLAERIRCAIEKHNFQLNGSIILNKTVSIGFAPFPLFPARATHVNWLSLIDLVDHCLYAAKKTQRNSWVGINTSTNSSVTNIDYLLTDTRQRCQQANIEILTSSLSTELVFDD